jgi:hypothetical protein
VDARVLEHFSVVLAGDVVDYFLAVEGGAEDGVVEYKQFADVLLVNHQKGLDFVPGVEHKFIARLVGSYPSSISVRVRTKVCMRP